ncbi:MAG: hypothetical protein UT82_C0016G0002 [Parcubacteria group bacterium GW2011_GWB1_40_14]|nr:MAG: hypothetical protein UT82_C0016G0002 [Parcubacteria group bacterium GW2011_GWB1_40_14]
MHKVNTIRNILLFSLPLAVYFVFVGAGNVFATHYSCVYTMPSCGTCPSATTAGCAYASTGRSSEFCSSSLRQYYAVSWSAATRQCEPSLGEYWCSYNDSHTTQTIQDCWSTTTCATSPAGWITTGKTCVSTGSCGSPGTWDETCKRNNCVDGGATTSCVLDSSPTNQCVASTCNSSTPICSGAGSCGTGSCGACTYSSWSNAGCGGNGCSGTQMYQTRIITSGTGCTEPLGQCVSDASCSALPNCNTNVNCDACSGGSQNCYYYSYSGGGSCNTTFAYSQGCGGPTNDYSCSGASCIYVGTGAGSYSDSNCFGLCSGAPVPPTVTTTSPTSVAATSATLNGTYNPNGSDTSAWFRYSTVNPGTCNNSFGTQTANTFPLVSGNSTIPYSVNISGLTVGQTYYYCAIANGAGFGYGNIVSFVAADPPLPGSGNVFVTSTTYNGNLGGLSGADAKCQTRASAAGLSGTWRAFLGDETIGPKERLFHSTNPYARMDDVSIANNWTDLTDGTLNAPINITEFGTATTNTSDGGFPVVFTSAVQDGSKYPVPNNTCNDWSSSSATNAAGGSANESASGWVSYISGGMCNGINYPGALYCFKQESFPSPLVTTISPTSVTETTATLNGSVNPNGSAATGWFRYSASNPGTCNDTFGTRVPVAGGTAVGSGLSYVPYSQNISSLTPGITYYYCAIGNNTTGTAFGSVYSFVSSTPPSPNVFVTSNSYTGNLGGLTGADNACMASASLGGLSGTWKAWLSTSAQSASGRLTHSISPYVRMDGVVIADNWTDLTDGNLYAPIDRNQYNEQINIAVDSRYVFTQSYGSGGIWGGSMCQDSTYGGSSGDGVAGDLTYTHGGWSAAAGGNICDLSGHIYCSLHITIVQLLQTQEEQEWVQFFLLLHQILFPRQP